MRSRERLVMDTFVEMADTLASDYDIGEFLHTLVERCAEILNVETGGVLVEGPDGHLQLAAATSDEMKDLEDLEIQLRQAPAWTPTARLSRYWLRTCANSTIGGPKSLPRPLTSACSPSMRSP